MRFFIKHCQSWKLPFVFIQIVIVLRDDGHKARIVRVIAMFRDLAERIGVRGVVKEPDEGTKIGGVTVRRANELMVAGDHLVSEALVP